MAARRIAWTFINSSKSNSCVTQVSFHLWSLSSPLPATARAAGGHWTVIVARLGKESIDPLLDCQEVSDNSKRIQVAADRCLNDRVGPVYIALE